MSYALSNTRTLNESPVIHFRFHDKYDLINETLSSISTATSANSGLSASYDILDGIEVKTGMIENLGTWGDSLTAQHRGDDGSFTGPPIDGVAPMLQVDRFAPFDNDTVLLVPGTSRLLMNWPDHADTKARKGTMVVVFNPVGNMFSHAKSPSNAGGYGQSIGLLYSGTYNGSYKNWPTNAGNFDNNLTGYIKYTDYRFTHTSKLFRCSRQTSSSENHYNSANQHQLGQQFVGRDRENVMILEWDENGWDPVADGRVESGEVANGTSISSEEMETYGILGASHVNREYTYVTDWSYYLPNGNRRFVVDFNTGYQTQHSMYYSHYYHNTYWSPNVMYFTIGTRRYTDRTAGRDNMLFVREILYFDKKLTGQDRTQLWEYLADVHNVENDVSLRDDDGNVDYITIPRGESLTFDAVSGHSLAIGQREGDHYPRQFEGWTCEFWYRVRDNDKLTYSANIPPGKYMGAAGYYDNKVQTSDEPTNSWSSGQTRAPIWQFKIRGLNSTGYSYILDGGGVDYQYQNYVRTYIRPVNSYMDHADRTGVWKHVILAIANVNGRQKKIQTQYMKDKNYPDLGKNENYYQPFLLIDGLVNTNHTRYGYTNFNMTFTQITFGRDQEYYAYHGATATEKYEGAKSAHAGLFDDPWGYQTVDLAGFRLLREPLTGSFAHCFHGVYDTDGKFIEYFQRWNPGAYANNNDVFSYTSIENKYDADGNPINQVSGLSKPETKALPLTARELWEWRAFTPAMSAMANDRSLPYFSTGSPSEWKTQTSDGQVVPENERGLIKDAVAQLTPIDIPPFLGKYPQTTSPWAGRYTLNNTLATSLGHFALPGWRTSFKNTDLYLNSNMLTDLKGLRPLYGMPPQPGDDIPTVRKELRIHYNNLTSLDDIEGSTFQTNGYWSKVYIINNPLNNMDPVAKFRAIGRLYMYGLRQLTDMTKFFEDLRNPAYIDMYDCSNVVSPNTTEGCRNLPAKPGVAGAAYMTLNCGNTKLTQELAWINCPPADLSSWSQTSTTYPIQGVYSIASDSGKRVMRPQSWPTHAEFLQGFNLYCGRNDDPNYDAVEFPNDIGTRMPNIQDVKLYNCGVIDVSKLADCQPTYALEKADYGATGADGVFRPWGTYTPMTNLIIQKRTTSTKSYLDPTHPYRSSSARQTGFTNKFNAGKTIRVSGYLHIPYFKLTDLRIFGPTLSLNGGDFSYTDLPNTDNGLGIIGKWNIASANWWYLKGCNLTSLSKWMYNTPANGRTKAQLYTSYTYRYIDIRYNKLTSMNFTLTDQFAGCQKLYIEGNDITHADLLNVLPQLTTMKNNGELRLNWVSFAYHGVDTGLPDTNVSKQYISPNPAFADRQGLGYRDWGLSTTNRHKKWHADYVGEDRLMAKEYLRTDLGWGREFTTLGQVFQDLADAGITWIEYSSNTSDDAYGTNHTSDHYRNLFTSSAYNPAVNGPLWRTVWYFRPGRLQEKNELTVEESSLVKGANNTLTWYVDFNMFLYEGAKIEIYGFGANKTGTPSGTMALGGNLATIFGGTGQWDNGAGKLTVTVAAGKKISMDVNYTLSFTIKNPTNAEAKKRLTWKPISNYSNINHYTHNAKNYIWDVLTD